LREPPDGMVLGLKVKVRVRVKCFKNKVKAIEWPV